MRRFGSVGGPLLVTLVITTCTNRKRKPVSDSLHVWSLPMGEIADVATAWCARIGSATSRYVAEDVYGGRGFQEAVTASALLDARLLVVSAGVGLIDASTKIPPYACTILADSRDSIGSRVSGGATPAEWWRALADRSPISLSIAGVAAGSTGLICAALSDTYIALLADDLLALPTRDLRRLRLFTRAPVARVPKALQPFVLPYDNRLDGSDSPIKGTRGDFSGRALHHFAKYVHVTGDTRSVEEHADAVSAAQAGWRAATRFARTRHDDEALKALIAKHWVAANGSGSRLLRIFRDDLNIACEQGRFAALVRDVRASMS